MRLVLAALAAAALSMPAAQAEEPPRLVIPVGEKVRLGGSGGRCDDLAIATITLDDAATITALKAGTTTCSSMLLGVRRVVRVVVEAPPPAKAPAQR
jgi:hypothetical protein